MTVRMSKLVNAIITAMIVYIHPVSKSLRNTRGMTARKTHHLLEHPTGYSRTKLDAHESCSYSLTCMGTATSSKANASVHLKKLFRAIADPDLPTFESTMYVKLLAYTTLNGMVNRLARDNNSATKLARQQNHMRIA